MTAGALSQEVSLRLDLKYKHILAYQITWMEITGIAGDSYFRFSQISQNDTQILKIKCFLVEQLTFVVEQAVFR